MFDSSKEKRQRQGSLENIARHAQYREDAENVRHRLQKSVPTFQRVVLMDMQRRKINQIYERRRHLDVTGPRGLDWQCKKELERLETNERDLKRARVDLAKMTLLPSIRRYPLIYQNHSRRLSSIAEENALLPAVEESKPIRARASSMNLVHTSWKPAQTQPSRGKINVDARHSQSFGKQYFQQVVAQTTDDRPYLQQQTRLMNEQKRLLEQKMKDFLH